MIFLLLVLQLLSTWWIPGTEVFLCSLQCMRLLSFPPELEASGTTSKRSLDTPFLLGHVLHEICYEVFSIKIFIDTLYLNVFQQPFPAPITSVICCLFFLHFRTWGMEMNAVTFLVPEGIKKKKCIFTGILKKMKHTHPLIYVYRIFRVKATCFVWKNHMSGLQWSQLWGTSLHFLIQPPQTLSFVHKQAVPLF